MTTERITRDELALRIAQLVSERATCNHLRVGCVFTKDGRIVVTGYNSSPAGLPHCIDVGCETDEVGACIRTLHAEVSAISYAARNGISLLGTTVYSTDSPCLSCAKQLITAGVGRLVYLREYRVTSGIHLLRSAGVEIEQGIIHGNC